MADQPPKLSAQAEAQLKHDARLFKACFGIPDEPSDEDKTMDLDMTDSLPPGGPAAQAAFEAQFGSMFGSPPDDKAKIRSPVASSDDPFAPVTDNSIFGPFNSQADGQTNAPVSVPGDGIPVAAVAGDEDEWYDPFVAHANDRTDLPGYVPGYILRPDGIMGPPIKPWVPPAQPNVASASDANAAVDDGQDNITDANAASDDGQDDSTGADPADGMNWDPTVTALAAVAQFNDSNGFQSNNSNAAPFTATSASPTPTSPVQPSLPSFAQIFSSYMAPLTTTPTIAPAQLNLPSLSQTFSSNMTPLPATPPAPTPLTVPSILQSSNIGNIPPTPGTYVPGPHVPAALHTRVDGDISTYQEFHELFDPQEVQGLTEFQWRMLRRIVDTAAAGIPDKDRSQDFHIDRDPLKHPEDYKREAGLRKKLALKDLNVLVKQVTGATQQIVQDYLTDLRKRNNISKRKERANAVSRTAARAAVTEDEDDDDDDDQGDGGNIPTQQPNINAQHPLAAVAHWNAMHSAQTANSGYQAQPTQGYSANPSTNQTSGWTTVNPPSSGSQYPTNPGAPNTGYRGQQQRRPR